LVLNINCSVKTNNFWAENNISAAQWSKFDSKIITLDSNLEKLKFKIPEFSFKGLKLRLAVDNNEVRRSKLVSRMFFVIGQYFIAQTFVLTYKIWPKLRKPISQCPSVCQSVSISRRHIVFSTVSPNFDALNPNLKSVFQKST
jgi:hypothetical protein